MLRKIFRKKKKEKAEFQSPTQGLKHKAQQISGFIEQSITRLKEEIAIIRKKCENLLETNYQLGMKHLDNGHINEATFRFRFIKKFWPDHLESYYQLSYCLILKNKFDEAQQVLEELVTKDKTYENDANELLSIIQTAKEKQ